MSDVALPKSVLHKFLQGQGLSFDFHRYFFLVQRRLWLLIVIVCLAVAGTFAWLSPRHSGCLHDGRESSKVDVEGAHTRSTYVRERYP